MTYPTNGTRPEESRNRLEIWHRRAVHFNLLSWTFAVFFFEHPNTLLRGLQVSSATSLALSTESVIRMLSKMVPPRTCVAIYMDKPLTQRWSWKISAPAGVILKTLAMKYLPQVEAGEGNVIEGVDGVVVVVVRVWSWQNKDISTVTQQNCHEFKWWTSQNEIATPFYLGKSWIAPRPHHDNRQGGGCHSDNVSRGRR